LSAIRDGRLWLFSYGTLQLEHVQNDLFGRTLASDPDALTGFILDSIAITDPDVLATSGMEVHKILRRSKDAPPIAGVALAIMAADLPAVDDYEGENYARIAVTLASGRRAFVYVAPEQD